MADYWKGVLDGDPSPYLQRILGGSNATRGTTFDDLHASSKEGTPLLMNPRTYPRAAGWEQRQEDKPWYTPTGRLEFYRPEREFQEAGESLPVWREPVDATFYDPNSILSNKEHPSIKPRGPEATASPSRNATPRRASTATSCTPGRSSARRSTRCTSSTPPTGSSSRRRSTAGARTRPPSTPTGSRCCSARSATRTGATRGARGRARRTSRSTRRTRSSSASTTATTPGSTPTRPTARTATGRTTTRTTTSPGR